MSETLTFGPEWLRNLSSGNSVTSPPPSPGPKYKLAEHRYGKEEMLALFSEDVKFPEELELFDSVCRSRPVLPLAFQPLTEEEQRNSVGSVNSNAVLKLMGRGGARGVGPPRGPGRGGIRGRGRGDGGYVRQTSYEDTRDGGGGFGRGIDTRRQGWNENSRGGFERSPSLRESGPSGPGRGGYDPSLARPRLSSDTSWERPERRSDSGNWRSGGLGGEDDDGWRISGQRSVDRSDKWRGGSTRGRAHWRGGPDSNRERGHPDDEWQTARSRRSYHDHEDVRWSSSNERLPEWSNDDTDDFNTPGTFDSSGAFVLHKQKEERDRSESERKSEEHKETTDRNNRSQSESDTSQNEDPDVWKEEQDDNIFSDTGTKTVSEERSTETSQPPAQKSPTTEQALNNLKKPSSTSASSSSQPHSPSSLNRQSSPTQSSAPNKPQSVSELAQAHLPSQPHVTMPSIAPQEDASVRKEEEPNMEHFAKAAENLVASLDDDEEDLHVKDVAKTTNQQQEFRTSPTTPDELQWSYTDPQGKVQGPFSNSEMADWFSHGYFTMGLLVKRTTDEVFQPLGEIIKQWGRVPFIPGPQPPPFKGVPEHIQRQQQQQMIAQQQYQHLMQQHYLQQQLFHQQALMMQQQQLQHNQQQMQQVQQPPQHSPPHNTSPPSTQHSQPQPTQGGAPSQQPVRPQAISPHAESIWGSTSPPQGTPSMITPGPWSPVKPTASSKGWDREKNQQHVPSFEEIQRIEEEKEKQTRLEIERREAKARALRLKQEEEERRRLQEAAMLKKQQEEEERRRQEEAERRRKEQEELQKKQQEEARRKQEEEMRRKQEQQEAMRKHEQQRQQLELQKKKEEQKRMNELRQQQQQALLRLQQQQELMRKKEMQQKAEMQQRELQQKLQQKRQESQVTGSLWGAPTPVSGTLSLAQIQQQEERERKQRELQLQQQLQAQQREQQSRGMPGWGDRPPPTNQPVKSLLQIQQEQARQLDKRQQGPVLSRSQPSHNPLSSSVWGNTGGSLSASWGPAANSGNIWGAAPPKPPQPQSYDEDDEEDDDDDSDDDDDDEEDDEGNGGSFWDDAVKAASKSQQQQRQQQPPVQQRQQQQPSQQPSNKVTEKRTNRDEENLRRLFQQQSSADEFSQWCYQSLRSLNNASSIDIPTFSAFLREVDSPYEVYDYVKQYLGDNRDTREFAREFIERRKKQKEKTPVSVASLHQAGVWGAPVSRGPPTGRPTGGNQSSAFLSGPVQDDPQDAMNKKKRKKKMQKVDPSILGFSVNAADRVNMGEIQTVED